MKASLTTPAIRHLLRVGDLSGQQIRELIQSGRVFKQSRQLPAAEFPLRGKTLGLLFEKASTRTRVSFEVAMYQLGGHAIFLSMEDLQIHRGETISDTAAVLSRYLNGIVIRTFGQETIGQWADTATIPVINGLTDLHHPCQALGDLLTLQERYGTLKGLKLAYVGDGNNVAHSLIEGAAKTGIQITLACPKGFEPNREIVARARKDALASDGAIDLVQDPRLAVQGADAIYTDVWVSMGKERETQKRIKHLRPYQVNDKLVSMAKPDVIVMHCLPAHREQEITAAVMDGPRSVILDQAENRLHIQKAILAWLLGGA